MHWNNGNKEFAPLKEGFSVIVSDLQLIRFISGFQDGEYDHFISWPSQSIVFTGIDVEGVILKLSLNPNSKGSPAKLNLPHIN